MLLIHSEAQFACILLAEKISSNITKDQILISCTKGILNDTLETVDEILSRVLPPECHSRLAYLSGPSFAAEVAAEAPTAVTIASKVRHAPVDF